MEAALRFSSTTGSYVHDETGSPRSSSMTGRGGLRTNRLTCCRAALVPEGVIEEAF